MHSNCRLLYDHIVCKITQRNNMRRVNTCDPALKLLNEEITSDIHKQNLRRENLYAHWDHGHNTHIIWKTIHGLSNRAPLPTLNTSITFNNKIATTRNTQDKQTINRPTQKIQGYYILLTTTQVQEAIKQSKNNKINLYIKHLKHMAILDSHSLQA